MPTFTVTAGTPIIPPGNYPASLVSVREKSMATKFSGTDKNGNAIEQDFLDWVFLVEGPDKDVEISMLSTYATGPKSKISMILTALMGPEKATEVGLDVDTDELIGTRVQVQIGEKDGFSVITNLMGEVKTRTAPAAVEAVVAPQPTGVSDDDLPF